MKWTPNSSHKKKVFKINNQYKTVSKVLYDNYGNIKKRYIDNVLFSSFEYDGIRLTKYNNKQFLYSGMYVTSEVVNGVTIKEYKWIGNKLIEIKDVENNKKYKYKYNINKQREIKEIYNIVSNTDVLVEKVWYYYNANGMLVREIRYEYNGNTVIDSKDISYLYDQNLELYGFILDGVSYYYKKDILGNIERIYDAEGVEVALYKSSAYGVNNVYYPNGSITVSKSFIGCINPIRFKGYYYDVETGLFMMGQRYYSPELCRFIQPADVSTLNPSSINGLNLYSYANNNPIGHVYSSIKLGTTINAKQINLHNGFILGNHSYGNNYPDLSFLSTGFSFIENTFSTFAGAVDGYRKIEKFDNIPGLKKASKILMWVGIGLNVALSAYESFLVNKSQSGPQKWGNFIGDVAYIAASSAITYGVGFLLGMIPYAGPFLAAPVSIFVGTLLDQIWSGEEVLWINGANISVKGKSIEEWFKDLLTEWFGG